MSLGKIGRKLKRIGKNAVQFRFTSTFEYLDLSFNGTWRPDTLRVVWLRNHRKVKSTDVQWVATEDRGPNGADGRANFEPIISVALIVTLYRESGKVDFQEKEYKYYIENEGPSGKKILATFNCDMSEYAVMPSFENTLAMSFKPVSQKLSKAVLGIILKSEFMKQGSSLDDDMQSTFSAMSAGTDVSFDGSEDEGDGSSGPRLSIVNEGAENALIRDAGKQTKSTLRKTVESQENYRPPLNPLLDDDDDDVREETPDPPSPTAKWLGEESMFVDCFGEGVGREKLDRAELIGLYFSASWCPPCRRFLPKLVKFYHHLKQHGKAFEILYISSDYSKQDMMKYMQQQQMPWVGLAFEGKIAQNLQKAFEVSAIPQLKVVSTKGVKVENQAKKLVEGTNSGTDVLRLYNKWHEKLEGDEDLESDGNQDHKEKKGLLQKVKNAIRGKDEVSLVEMQPQADGQPPKANGELFSVKLVEDLPATRQVVECRSRGRSTISLSSKSKISVEALLEEKEERVRYLEEVNMTLKQTNDDLNEEVTEIKKQLMDMQAKLSDLEATSKQLEDDKRESVAKLSTRGWLYKRGVKGPTAKVWRRRYFRCDQGTKICYYKSAAEGAPQGFIDLEKVISVQEVSSAQQDKNNATFFIQCDGRTFHLQAHDESTMRKWMSAIEYLRNWHKKNSVSTNGGGATV